MPEILDDIAYLSQEIGPRPAGTEEEQQAALYITEQLQKRAGLQTEIEDFSCSSEEGIVEVICFGIPLIFSIAAMITSMLVIPCFIVALACAALYGMEIMGRPMLSRLLSRGVSQNVVAKYTPSTAGGGKRSRKIILVSHYDSGKVSAELNGGLFGIYPMAQKASFFALLALPLIWLIRGLAFLNVAGSAAVVWNVITIVAIVLVALPIALFFMHKAATYNEAANDNASGVAVLMETARRVAAGRMSEEEIALRAQSLVHGEEEARAAGLVPEGAVIEYAPEVAVAQGAAAADAALEPVTERERLDAAKAAVAAMTGAPLHEYAPAPNDISGKLVQVREPALGQVSPEQAEALREEAKSALSGEGNLVKPTPAAPTPDVAAEAQPQQPAAQSFEQPGSANDDVPDWFKTAQEKANKPSVVSAKPIRRSRYADALDAAVAASSAHFEEANRVVDRETEERLNSLREGIVEVKAPSIEEEEHKIAAARAAAQAATDETIPMAPITQDVAAQQPAAPTPQPAVAPPAYAAPQNIADQPAYVEPAPVPAPRDRVEVPYPSEPAPQAQVQHPQIEEAPVDAGATTAMPPLDVSSLRAAASRTREEAARALQGRAYHPASPSAVEQREAAPHAEASREFHDFSQISAAPSFNEAPQVPASQAAAVPPVSAPQPIASAARVEPRVEQESFEPHLPITLPEVEKEDLPPVSELSKQRAPLAEAAESGVASSNPSLSSQIPRISLGGSGAIPGLNASAPIADNKRAALRNTLPSMSGSITAVAPEPAEPENVAVSTKGSFVAAGATGTFAPVGDELVEDVAPEDMYIEDADDSSYDENVTETGAFAGPGYMDMPESRAHRFFGKFRRNKNKKQAEQSAADWIGVDDSFNPTEVGAARGGWESFQQEGADYQDNFSEDANQQGGYADEDGYFDDTAPASPEPAKPSRQHRKPRKNKKGSGFDPDGELYDEDDWNGGAFSKLRAGMKRGDGIDEDMYDDDPTEMDYFADDAPVSTRPPRTRRAPEAVGEEASDEFIAEAAPSAAPRANVVAGAPDQASRTSASAAERARVAEEIKQVYKFRNPDVDVEVWFVALGSELTGNGGAKAFLAEHASELRGSIIINLEALGAGKTTYIDNEGLLQTKTPSSRMKRYLKKATQASGVTTSTAKIGWRESAASLAMKQGYQAMSVVGMDGGKPAMLGQGDDVLENIDLQTLNANADFVMGLIKNA